MASTPTPESRPGWRTMSLRALMLLIVVVAGWLGWICHRARVQREAVAAIERAGGHVKFDWELDPATVEPKPGSPSPGWLRRQLGPGFFEEVADVFVLSEVDDVLMFKISRLSHLKRLTIFDKRMSDANLADVAGLTHLKDLVIPGTGVTNSGLYHLRFLRELKFLWLYGCSVTDIEPLKHLSQLKALDLGQTQVDDAGLAPVANFHALKYLRLSEAPITDAGSAHLRGLTALNGLDLRGTRITDEGLKNLARLSQLEFLCLDETRISDLGLDHLTGLKRCGSVGVTGTRVTPEGVEAMRAKCPWMTILR